MNQSRFWQTPCPRFRVNSAQCETYADYKIEETIYKDENGNVGKIERIERIGEH
jgi:hypothetical protein